MNKGVVIQASFYEAMCCLSDEERLKLYDGICRYGLLGIMPEQLSPVSNSLFILMKPNIDSSLNKYNASVKNGKTGGRPTKNQTSDQQENQNKKPRKNQSKKPGKNQSMEASENHDIEIEKDIDYDIDYDIEMDTDTDGESWTAALPPRSPKSGAEKHRYGEYKNVLLTDEEAQKLKELLPNMEELVEHLSEYIASTGKKYKSHYATLRAWYRREPKSTKPPQLPEDDLSDIL